MSVIQNFYENGIKNIHAVNRSKKFLQINESLSLVTNNLSRLGSLIQSTDILVTSVNSPLPIIGKGLIENAMKERKNKPMLLIDLGVPRNIEDQVRDLEYAYLFTIEDIEHVTQENLEERSIEAKRAKILIQERVKALSQDKIKKENRNEAYKVLENICEVMSEKDLSALLRSDDPYKCLKKIDVASADQLKQIAVLSPHAIFSMIQEIRSA
jgi:glutamyl-tRNA reductase